MLPFLKNRELFGGASKMEGKAALSHGFEGHTMGNGQKMSRDKR